MSPEFRIRIFKDPWSSWTRFVGFWIALVAVAALICRVADDAPKATAIAAYGGTLVLLFLASSLYHWFDLGERGHRWLQRVDYAAIFLLIGGTYIPALVHLLKGTWRISMLARVIGLALAGALFKILWIDCPTWLGLTLYFALSFIVFIPAHIILPELSGVELTYLIIGGLAYSLAAVVFASVWPDPWPDHFGHHEVWHLFVLVGAAAHDASTYTLIDLPYPPF